MYSIKKIDSSDFSLKMTVCQTKDDKIYFPKKNAPS